MESLETAIQAIRDALWGTPVLLLLFGVGVYLTWILKGMQFRYAWYALKLVWRKDKGDALGDISPLASLMTSMASAVGTGSIVGVSTAIMAGGLGSVFWLWVMALVSMAIKYGESLLAVKYRVTDENGEMCGGPMYYIEKGLNWKWLAIFFAFAASIAAIGTGNLVQINSISEVLHHAWGIKPLYTGIVLCAITALVLIGGIQSIASFSSWLVPIMAIIYIGGGLAVLGLNMVEVPAAFATIVSSAFTGQAATGAFLGSSVAVAIQMGVARSIFSSEAGMGISSIASAAAKTTSSGRQAMLSMTATLVSTAVICSITALVLAVTGSIGLTDASGKALNGASLAIHAFSGAIPGGEYVIVVGLVLFAYTTVVAWAYYGEKCFEYLFGVSSVMVYRIIYTLLIVPGSVFALDLLWTFADAMNALMVIPNMIALLGLAKVIKSETDIFLDNVQCEESLRLAPEVD